MGGHSKVTPEIADEIVERLSGGEPLRAICRDEHMPSWMSVYRRINADDEFALRIARARELGQDALAEECMEIADDSRNDFIEKQGKNGESITAFDAEHVQRSKLRIETRLKLLAKWNPKKYGDMVKHAGPEGEALPMSPVINVFKPGDDK